MEVTLLNHMGSDLTVVNAARVSFNKESTEIDQRDIKLINYLAEHGHWSPFSHCFLQFRIKAPIFVARQLGKHQVGLSWNEVSRRYVDYEPEFYIPERWRKRADSVKQGSSSEEVSFSIDAYMNSALQRYEDMLKADIAPEVARMILPQNMYTEWWWSGSLMAFARVVNQRKDKTAQKECRDIAEMISQECARFDFKHSWKALTGEERKADDFDYRIE